MLFTLLRLAAYAGGLTAMALSGATHPWWHWVIALATAAWGVWEKWKRPDEPPRTMRLGVLLEWLAVVGCSLTVGEPAVLLLLLSPLARSAVHLPGREALAVGVVSLLAALGSRQVLPAPAWLLPAQVVAFGVMGPYAYVLGRMARERDEARRQVELAAFEREQRSRDEERVRMAAQLHDVMGQYWAGVIRALDVALLTEGDTQRQFLTRARQAAMEGLEEMRTAVRTWNEGQQTAAQWQQFMETAVGRFRDVVGVQVEFRADPVDWLAFADPVAAAEAVARTTVEALTNAVRHGGRSESGLICTAGPAV